MISAGEFRNGVTFEMDGQVLCIFLLIKDKIKQDSLRLCAGKGRMDTWKRTHRNFWKE